MIKGSYLEYDLPILASLKTHRSGGLEAGAAGGASAGEQRRGVLVRRYDRFAAVLAALQGGTRRPAPVRQCVRLSTSDLAIEYNNFGSLSPSCRLSLLDDMPLHRAILTRFSSLTVDIP